MNPNRITNTAAAVLLTGALMLTSCSSNTQTHYEGRADRHYRVAFTDAGSAGRLRGRSVVVSIFASDPVYEWNFDRDDKASEKTICSFLDMAANYLQSTAESYGVKTVFVTDFVEHPDLFYTMSTDEVITDESVLYDDTIEQAAWDFIDNNIDEQSIRDEYRADNVIYMMFMNTDVRTDAVSCTRSWYPGMPSDAEVVFLFNYDYGLLNPPAVYAHEILHTFGAPDLYSSSEFYNITDEFVEYAELNLPNEIMLTCSDPQSGDYLYDVIVNEVSELTAYYVGLTDRSDIVDEWGLTDPTR